MKQLSPLRVLSSLTLLGAVAVFGCDGGVLGDAGEEAGSSGGAGGSGGSATSSGSGGSTGGSATASGAGGSGGSAGSGGSSGSGAGGSAGGSGGSGGSGAGGSAGSGGSGGGLAELPDVIPGQCPSDLGGYQNGSVTFYYLDQGTELVHCSYPETQRNPDKISHVLTGDGGYFGAINTSDYANSAMCGACVEVTRDGSKKVTVTIVDECPFGSNNKCKAGHIDLSREAFKQLGTEQEGYLGTGNGGMYGSISWKYVPCPTGETVHFKLKDASNKDWNEVMVSGATHAIEKLEVFVNGTWATATRKEYNYFEPPGGKMGTAPYRVRVTDITGSVLEAYVELNGNDQDSGRQFSCQ